jgi:hypothetical protein
MGGSDCCALDSSSVHSQRGLLMDTSHLFEVGFDGPAFVEPFNAEVRALAPEERVAAVAASLESVRP